MNLPASNFYIMIRNDWKSAQVDRLIRLSFFWETRTYFIKWQTENYDYLTTWAPTIGFSVVCLGANSCGKTLIITAFKLGNCTNPRADYEIQLVGAGVAETLIFIKNDILSLIG